MIVDTACRTTDKAACLKGAGVTTVIRYYARVTRLPEKRLTRDEAEALVAAGLAIGAVFQNAGDGPSSFSAAIGADDGRYVRDYAIGVIGQPAGSAIWFAVDYHPDDDDLARLILPHFAAIQSVLSPRFRVGVYGDARVCGAVVAAGLADLAWLSGEAGDGGVERWTLRQSPPTTICGLPVDANTLAPGVTDFGAFAALDPPAV